MDQAKPIWTPSPERIARAGITRYRKWLEERHGLRFDDYESLWRWSVDELETFWATIWVFTGMRSATPYRQVLEARRMPGAKWFDGALVNYADHMLWRAALPDWKDRPAIIFQSERVERREISWGQLAAQVGALTATLKRLGVAKGDRVVAYVPNIPEAMIASLAAISLGAVWSSCAPDMGTTGVLDRFRQIEPKLLFAVDGYRYGGKDFDRCQTVQDLVAELPTVETVIFLPYLNIDARLETIDGNGGRNVTVISFAEAIAQPAACEFTPLPFDHPLWIVYSSGTTGMPKPIVHGHGGTVIEYAKSAAMHLDIGEGDRVFWFTSTNWIMWNVTVSVLAAGCTVLLFDGNPGHPDLGTLWRFAERERANFFGLSPAFVQLNMKAGLVPREQFDLSSLRTIGSTGSPLTENGYQWVYESVHPDVMLASISGGTDPNTAFLGACPVLPIYAGEMQCRGLGLGVHAYDESGESVIDQVGELVCTTPVPSMPLYFWGDAGGTRYFESYFDVYPGVWRHGDWLKLVPRAESLTGIIYGRSDSTINRHGIRMGTSELYRVVEDFDEVADSLVIDLEYLGRESFMALFLVLRDGAAEVPDTLRKSLLDAIRTRLSARHVPNEVFVIPAVPRTISGKKLEVPVKKILLGQPVDKSVNRSSMANPTSIDWFIEFERRRSA